MYSVEEDTKLKFFNQCKDEINNILNNIPDLKREYLNIVPSYNRYGGVSIYINYYLYEIRISDHMKNENFNTSNYNIYINTDFFYVKKILPEIIKEINSLVVESEYKRNEKARLYEEKKQKDLIIIKEKRKKELVNIDDKVIDYMKKFINHPNKEHIKELVDKFIKDYIDVKDYPKIDRPYDKLKTQFSFPNSKERNAYINKIKYEQLKRGVCDGQ